ncbi:MAG: hypothetical protein JNJ99_15565, partial [Crocinitomicaceae bacterium]|nr:hypothetical protein [Crocinitomicaceae bacterium]
MKIKLLLISVLFYSIALGQNEIWIRPNHGQWHDNVEYLINVPGGQMFLENGGFTYAFTNFGKNHIHDDGEKHHDEEIKSHVVRTKFLNANSDLYFEELNQASFYENYFLGNDSTRWRSEIVPCNEVRYKSLYNQIDLHLYEQNATLKYDVVVHP